MDEIRCIGIFAIVSPESDDDYDQNLDGSQRKG